MSPSEMPRSTQAPRRRRTLGAFIIILVLCLVSFAVGIFIGKNNKSSQQAISQPQLTHTVARSATLPAPVKKPVANVVVGADVVAPETAMAQSVSAAPNNASVVPVETGENSEVQKEDLVNGEIVREQSPLGNGLNQPETAPVVAASVAKDAAAKVQAEIVKLAPTVEKSPATKLINSSDEYVVQVGSFKKISDAEKVQAKLRSTFAVQVKRADLGQKGIWYRVLVGPVSNVAEAGKVKDSLQQKFKLSGFVKKNI